MTLLFISFLITLSVLGGSIMLALMSARLRKRALPFLSGSPSSYFTDHSLYRFIGIPLDVLGVLYYVFVAVLASMFFTEGGVSWGVLFFVLLFGSLFSLYMLLVQIVAVKSYCEWSFIALTIPIIALGGALLSVPADQVSAWIVENISELHLLMVIMAAAGVALSTVSFFVFMTFMEDMRLSSYELQALSVLSEGAWISVVGFFTASISLVWVTESIPDIQSLSFLMGVMLVIAVCEFVKLTRIRPAFVWVFLKRGEQSTEERGLLKRLAFGVEGLTFVSWLCVALFLLVFDNLSVAYMSGVYILIIAVSVLLSQLVRTRFHDDSL